MAALRGLRVVNECHQGIEGVPPPPPCISYALVQATVGVGTVIILYVIYLCTKRSVAT